MRSLAREHQRGGARRVRLLERRLHGEQRLGRRSVPPACRPRERGAPVGVSGPGVGPRAEQGCGHRGVPRSGGLNQRWPPPRARLVDGRCEQAARVGGGGGVRGRAGVREEQRHRRSVAVRRRHAECGVAVAVHVRRLGPGHEERRDGRLVAGLARAQKRGAAASIGPVRLGPVLREQRLDERPAALGGGGSSPRGEHERRGALRVERRVHVEPAAEQLRHLLEVTRRHRRP